MPDPEYKIIVQSEDGQVEVTLRAPNGDRWEYGIPFDTQSGRFAFEDIKVIEIDFGADFADKMLADIRTAVKAAIGQK